MLRAASAQTPTKVGEVVTVTTKRQVDIGLMYNGDHIYFFGNVPPLFGDAPDPDVIVKLTSTADAPIIVNRKGRVAFFWMNVKQLKISGLPLLYKIHSTRPISQILSPKVARELGIGYDILKDRMQIKLLHGQAEPDDRDTVFEGILRLKQEANLYNIDEKRIEITGGTLFKHYFRFPSAATEGAYRAESYVLRDGKLIGKGVDEVVIRKAGVEAAFTKLSGERPVIYGCIAVAVALGMGLLMGFVFKKGGGH
jgi:uncharacterized protein (TIGR02186 family)